jgi:ferrochelatase
MKKALVLLNSGDARNKDELEVFLRNIYNDKNLSPLQNETLRSMVASITVFAKLNSLWSNYEQIGSGSALHDETDKLIKKLQGYLPEYFITPAMRYTSPFTQTAIARIEELGIKEVVLLPLSLYYSTITTGSIIEDFTQKAEGRFSIKIIEPYYKNFLLNKAICDDIVQTLGKYNDFHLIFVARGVPQERSTIEDHLEILKENLIHYAVNIKSINLAYLSKSILSKKEKPTLETTLKHFKNKKVVIYPLFTIVENIDTAYELGIKYKEIAQDLGLKEYKVVPCLNDHEQFVKAISNIITTK